MRFGLQLSTYPAESGHASWQKMLAVTRLAEQCGFESAWYEDHFMFRNPEHPEVQVPQFECLTTLAGLAAATQTIQLGMLVLGTPYRNPALLAKMLSTIEALSGGRCIIGLGAGWHEEEFRAYGWPFPPLRQRLEMLEEAVQLIRTLTTQRPASFSGKHFTLDRALNEPMPERPLPILVGGNGEKQTLRIAARYADLCNVYGTVEVVAHKFAVLRQHLADANRDPDAVTRTINYWTVLARDEADRERLKTLYPGFTPELPGELRRWLDEYEKVGTQVAIVKIINAAELEPVKLFQEEIIKK